MEMSCQGIQADFVCCHVGLVLSMEIKCRVEPGDV